MEAYARFIHKSNVTYLPTILTAQFFGLPDGKVHIIYARFYEIKFERSGLEFVFAVHKDFSYDYEKGKLIPKNKNLHKVFIFNEMVDNPDLNFKILKVCRNMNSYSEAVNYLNKKAWKMINDRQTIKGYKASETSAVSDFNQ
jgi:hypothetical protein